MRTRHTLLRPLDSSRCRRDPATLHATLGTRIRPIKQEAIALAPEAAVHLTNYGNHLATNLQQPKEARRMYERAIEAYLDQALFPRVPHSAVTRLCRWPHRIPKCSGTTPIFWRTTRNCRRRKPCSNDPWRLQALLGLNTAITPSCSRISPDSTKPSRSMRRRGNSTRVTLEWPTTSGASMRSKVRDRRRDALPHSGLPRVLPQASSCYCLAGSVVAREGGG